MKHLNVIVPAYNEEESVIPLYSKLTEVLKSLKKPYDIIFVDDGSTDNTFKVLSRIHAKDKNVKIISFRKNFGKAAALSAAFEFSDAEIVITMDADLQDDPLEIPRFIEIINKGYDLVSGWKKMRHDPLGKRLPSKFFNWLTRKASRVKVHDFNCGFKAYRREVVKNVKIYGELHRYIPALAYWQGYKIAELVVRHHPRKYGKSKYGLERLLKGFLDLITITYLTSFRIRPMHLFGTVGLLFASLGFISGFYLFVQWLMGVGIGKRPLLMLSMLMMILGIQFFSIGLVAEMITNSNERQENSYSIKKVLK